MSKPILSLDFDGVLHSYTNGWEGADIINDPPVAGAMHFLQQATEVFTVSIFSSRSNQTGGIDAMRQWIFNHLDEVFGKTEARRVISLIKFPTEKPPAFITLDDRCVQFTGLFPDPNALLNFKAWNKGGEPGKPFEV